VFRVFQARATTPKELNERATRISRLPDTHARAGRRPHAPTDCGGVGRGWHCQCRKSVAKVRCGIDVQERMILGRSAGRELIAARCRTSGRMIGLPRRAGYEARLSFANPLPGLSLGNRGTRRDCAPVWTRRRPSVTKPIQTRAGDVLILNTAKAYIVFAVGRVSKDGQLDFNHEPKVQHVSDSDTAIATAKALRAPGQRILLRDLDTGEWSEVSTPPEI
jgi:hypothetical protein